MQTWSVLNAEDKLRDDEDHDEGDGDQAQRPNPARCPGGRFSTIGRAIKRRAAPGIRGFPLVGHDRLLAGSVRLCMHPERDSLSMSSHIDSATA